MGLLSLPISLQKYLSEKRPIKENQHNPMFDKQNNIDISKNLSPYWCPDCNQRLEYGKKAWLFTHFCIAV